MAGQWLVMVRGKQAGPISSQRLKALADQGKISPDDLVCPASDSSWVPARRVKGLFPATTPPAEPAPPAPPTAPAPPAPPEIPSAQPGPVDAPPMGVHVVADSPTARVLAGRSASRRRNAWWKSKAASAIGVVVLLAVPAVGIGVVLSGRNNSASGGAKPVPVAGAAETLPQERVLSDSELKQAKAGDLEIDGIGDLEKLGILDSPADAAGADQPDKSAASQPPAKTQAVAAKPSSPGESKETPEPQRQALAAKGAPDARGSEGPQQPPAEFDPEDPVDAINKINADIASLGGGEDSLDYGNEESSDKEQKQPAAGKKGKKDRKASSRP